MEYMFPHYLESNLVLIESYSLILKLFQVGSNHLKLGFIILKRNLKVENVFSLGMKFIPGIIKLNQDYVCPFS